MLNCINSIMLFKKIYFVILLALACSTDHSTPKPVVPDDSDEPKQYGVPFAAVPDPRNSIIYEVNIRAFSPGGDLQGVINKLDYIKQLGINTIWLMPIHPVGQLRSAGGLGSPYSVRNYLEVNSEFGDLQKLRELVQGAHDRNMAVILDWVANHTSWDNPWISNKSWYAQDASGNIIIPPGTNWQDVAELNYDNHDMRKAMIHALKYWVLEANVDGFRCDAVDYVPSDFWKQALDELKSIPDRKLIFLAEGGKQENFGAGFQMNYAWDFYNNLKEVYTNGKSAASVFTTHEAEYNNIPQGAIKLRYTTNHDESAWEATPVEIFGSEQAALSASVITIFTSAAPLIYSSQEVGRSEKLPFFTREPINWDTNLEMIEQYETLLNIYNQTPVFMNGTLQAYPDNNVVIFTRNSGDDQYMVAVNVRNEPMEVVLDPSLQNQTWTDMLHDEPFSTNASLMVSANQYLILKRN
jgi:glycosidase